MDARIGTLNNGKFFAFVDGYDKPEFVGTLEEVEIALGLRSGDELKAARSLAGELTEYDVVMTFQFPAWDETDGLLFPGVRAKTKREAISIAARQARADGHAATGKGKYWFRATETA